MNQADYLPLIKLAFEEDLKGNGDVTSSAIFQDQGGAAVLISKDRGVLAGIDLFSAVYKELASGVEVNPFFRDGDLLVPGDRVAELTGPVYSLLCGERVALNFLSTLSGIATRTAEYVKAAADGGRGVVLDTRKTIPGFRALSKYAVKVGGGTNHRMGLHDMVMIKDNHIDAAGSITGAVNLVRKKWANRFRIEVECRSLKEVEEALALGVDVIMLDNMTMTQMAEAVALVKGRVKLEASGNIELVLIKELSALGVDYISVGKLTKSVEAFDFSLKIDTCTGKG